MKFQTNTKPFSDALAIGIINANVSNFHKKSCIVQLTATSDTLKINVESSMIKTELILKGSGEGEEATVFVDSLLLKQLASTLDSPTITLDITNDGLTIISGKSKFSLAKMLDSGEIELSAPSREFAQSEEVVFDKEDWKFVKDFQMYAISMAFVHPVYTRVWSGDSGDVLVGNFDAGLFTHSDCDLLGTTCLLKDSIINLFTSLPEETKIYRSGRDYIVTFTSDSFEYVTQFEPEYEEDEGVGSYSADVFLDTMKHPDNGTSIEVQKVTKLLNQATLLSTSTEDTIEWSVKDSVLKLVDRSVDGVIPIQQTSEEYSLSFRLDQLKQVIANYSDEFVFVQPVLGAESDEVAGIVIWNNRLTTLISGVE